MISKKSTITTMIALTALALVTAPSVLTLGSVYAFNLGNIGNLFGNGGSGNSGSGNLFGGISDLIKNAKDLGKSDGKSSVSDKDPDISKDPDTGSSGGNAGIGAKCGNSGHDTFHWYCHGTYHHCLKGEHGWELFGGRPNASAK